MNLANDLRNSARNNPGSIALIYEGEQTSYGQLDQDADRVAAGLYKMGVRKGDRVAFALANRPVFASLHYGILRAGAVSVPLNTSLKASELRPYLSSVAPRAIVSGEDSVNEIMSAGPFLAPVFVVGKHSTARPFHEVLASGGPVPEVQTDLQDLAVIAYTSGTSGFPKGAMLSHGNLSENMDQMLQVPVAKTEPDDIVLGVLPMFHIYALNVILGLSIRQGATVLLQDRFDPAGSLGAVTQHKATILVGAPPMFISWLTLAGADAFDLSSVRFAISGASAIAPEVITSFKSMFGIEIWEGYGLTETAPTVTTTRMAEQRVGSVGKPLPGIELRLVDPAGDEVQPGDPGEIWVRGPNVFQGYWADDAATEHAFAGDWLRTGDVGYRDEDGYLFLVDRKKELIIVSGFNVYPREVEDALRLHPEVADVAVIGVPHPRQGESIKAIVIMEPNSEAGESDLIVHATKHLARFKVPTEVEFVQSLPRLASGKLLKRMLRPVELGPNS